MNNEIKWARYAPSPLPYHLGGRPRGPQFLLLCSNVFFIRPREFPAAAVYHSISDAGIKTGIINRTNEPVAEIDSYRPLLMRPI